MSMRRQPPTVARVIVAMAAAAAAAGAWTTGPERTQDEAPANPAQWNYIESRDRLSRWLWLTAESAEVETPAGPLPPEATTGRVQLTIEASCRAGESPLELVLTFPPHPAQPETTRTLSLRNLWWELIGRTPERHRHETTVTLGTSTFATAFTRERVVYEFEPDYRAVLDTARSAAELLRDRDTGLVGLTAGGETPIEAVFDVPAGYRERLRQMLESCG